MKYELTKEMVKAIRLLNGYNTDLRVDISGAVNQSSMWDFIDSIFVNLFGLDAIANKWQGEPGHQSLTDAYERIIRRCVKGVCTGSSVNFEI